MEKLIAGVAVFLAVVCGQPDVLAVLCLYLAAAIGVTAFSRSFSVVRAD
jgi:hypothetical protein